MKPLWTPTLAWLAAVLAAFVLALLLPEAFDTPVTEFTGSHGAVAPR